MWEGHVKDGLDRKKTEYTEEESGEQQKDLEEDGATEQQGGLKPRFQRAGAKASSLPRMHLVVVACGDRTRETLTMLKSAAALTSEGSLVFHIFSEKHLQAGFARKLEAWLKQYREKIEYRVYDITLGTNAEWWLHIFKRRCAYQRLFLHTLLADVDAVIYVDTDTLFLTSVTSVWDNFARFNASQIMGLVANHENKKGGGWYKRNTKLRGVFVHPSGVNSGVILMNLTRLRHSNWSGDIWHYSHVHQKQLDLVDQDIYNIYLHFHPDQLFLLDCTLNFRTDHCSKRFKDNTSACLSAEKGGVRILHGNRQAFHRNRMLSSIYNAFDQYKLGDDLHTGLLYQLRDNLRKKATPCSTPMFLEAFIKHLTEVVAKIHSPRKKG
ncbi:glucoside xylosyltransferase 2-like isoform X2 [Babylonia areolata]|uniref:glucoside xylosyltransferase 2-like isoform X2 n=1 Tax=Babylonia areolata TaxID=304850 RepID=UPI003FD5E065